MHLPIAFATASTLIALAAALPNPSSNSTEPLNTRVNQACGLHWHSEWETSDNHYPTTVTWIKPEDINGPRKVKEMYIEDPAEGAALCDDAWKLCLTVNDNGGAIWRFGFGADVWLDADTPRCFKGKRNQWYKSPGVNGYSQDGDCSFACKDALK